MPFKQGERTITGRERIFSDYSGDPNVPHAENFIDIEPVGDKTLAIYQGREPNDPGGKVILEGITSLVINDRKIDWVEEVKQ